MLKLLLIICVIGLVVRFFRLSYRWADYVAYFIVIALPVYVICQNEGLGIIIFAIVAIGLPLYYLLGLNRKVKYNLGDKRICIVKCTHCSYNDVSVTTTDGLDGDIYYCGRCGHLTQVVKEGDSVKLIDIGSNEEESGADKPREITKLLLNLLGIIVLAMPFVIFIATIIFTIWQPTLNLLPTLIFPEDEFPTLSVLIPAAYVCMFVASTLSYRFMGTPPLPVPLFLLLLLIFQFSDSHTRDAIFELAQQRGYLIYGTIAIIVAGLALPYTFFLGRNKFAQNLCLAVVGWMIMYTLYRFIFPISIDMEYSYTFANHLIRFVCLCIMALPMVLALLHIASNLGTFEPLESVFFPLGIIFVCELLPVPYTKSLYLHIPLLMIYCYSAIKIGGFLWNWMLGSEILTIEVENPLSFREMWTPKVRSVAIYMACSAIFLFALSSVLMNFVVL